MGLAFAGPKGTNQMSKAFCALEMLHGLVFVQSSGVEPKVGDQ